MDEAGLDPAEHRRALAGLRRINAWSGTVGAIWPLVRDRCRSATRGLRLLDLACGGGEVAIGLRRRARREGLALDVTGCDRSPVAVAAARAASTDVSFEVRDVIADGVPRGYDVLLSTLFLHHLDAGTARAFLHHMADSGAGLLIVDDLARELGGWVLAWAGSRVLSRSWVVHVDALRSVEAAFKPAEAEALAREAGWGRVEVRRHWPARYQLVGALS